MIGRDVINTHAQLDCSENVSVDSTWNSRKNTNDGRSIHTATLYTWTASLKGMLTSGVLRCCGYFTITAIQNKHQTHEGSNDVQHELCVGVAANVSGIVIIRPVKRK